jgi:predicted ATP-grasp superfamily ATP-dependent carboligase
MANILIPDGLGTQVRDGIRSLHREGDICDIAGSMPFIRSHYISNYHIITPAGKNDVEYINGILALCKSFKYDLILPFSNDSYYAISKHSNVLSENEIKFMVPDFQIFQKAHDKYRTIEFCKQLGIKTPQLFSEYSDNDIGAIGKYVRYPVVIKAKSGTGVLTGVRYANNREELLRYYDEITAFRADTGASNYDSPLIQEFIPGFINDACTLTDHGKVVAVLTQRRHIMYPIYGGVGAVNVTTHDDGLKELATRILEALMWHGPAQVEFKYDTRDRQYKLIEINPKLWGTLDLSIKVGVCFPNMIRDILLGNKIYFNEKYPANIRYWFISEAALAYMQLIKEFGLNHIIDQNNYSKTIYGFDSKDLDFELRRINRAFKSIIYNILGKNTAPNSNIPKEYVNMVNSSGNYKNSFKHSI